MASIPSAGPKIEALFPDVVIDKIPKPQDHPAYHYQGFHPGSTVLEKGHVRNTGNRAFDAPCIFDRDLAIKIRDGAKLYADIFRPPTSDSSPVPAILPWSPYGKTGTGPQNYDHMGPFRCGIAKDQTSGYEKFEGPDPAEWCQRGYAIANVDARGAGHSEGIIAQWGNQEAEDVYDVIEYLSQQPWCNGSVVMAGNSWLAIAQINYAARVKKHPALKALAPWESFTDPYRQLIARGGRPHVPKFHDMIKGGFAGPEGAENMVVMLKNRPLYDDYWEAKRIPVENIEGIPLYVLASYSSMLHTYGSFQTFHLAKTDEKWLRIHPYQEWFDFYRKEITDDLQLFFDRYAKNIDNGWETKTPRVRLSLLAFDGSDAQVVIERPETAYPLQRQQLQKLYLDATTMTLIPHRESDGTNVLKEAKASYQGHHLTDCLSFKFHFDKATELAGYPKAILYMSCPDANDMDITVQIRKIDRSGKPLAHLNYPCPVAEGDVPNVNVAKTLGPQGFLRASHHVSKVQQPSNSYPPLVSPETDVFYTHRERQPIEPLGTIVKLEIPIWPIGMIFAAGEGIVLNVSGHDMCLPETESCTITEPEDGNVGTHVLHTGGNYESVLILPVIDGSV